MMMQQIIKQLLKYQQSIDELDLSKVIGGCCSSQVEERTKKLVDWE
jgi:hypothetical protein